MMNLSDTLQQFLTDTEITTESNQVVYQGNEALLEHINQNFDLWVHEDLIVEQEFNALHLAILTGQHQDITKLCESGIEINATDSLGRSPLAWAVALQHPVSIKALIKAGAKPRSSTPLKKNTYMPILWDAIMEDNGVAWRALLEAGINIQSGHFIMGGIGQYNRFADTPLHLAAALNHHRSIFELKSLPNIDINALHFGQTALHVAVEFGNSDAILTLIDLGADITITNDRGQNALQMATALGRANVVTTLLQYMDANDTDQDGHTIVDVAVFTDNIKMLQILLQLGRINEHTRQQAFLIAQGKKDPQVVACFSDVRS